MSLSITHLGSGSSGNSTLLMTENTRILVDQGFSGKKLEKKLASMGIKVETIDAVFISHHHGDHGGGAGICQRKWNLQVYCNERTAQELDLDFQKTTLFNSLDLIQINDDICVLPVPVPHSGSENVGFVVSHDGERCAVITDLGSFTNELIQHVRGCEHISIEANYDERRLRLGPYPQSLKDRITGSGGHLSNDQTGEFLQRVVTEQTRSITLTHLSQRNNAPHLAESTVLYYIDEIFEGDIFISGKNGPEFTHFIGKNRGEKEKSGILIL